MKFSRKVGLIMMLAATAAVIAIFHFSALSESSTPVVVLPTPAFTEFDGSDGDISVGQMDKAEIGRDTVQAAISALIRLESYSRTVKVENFFENRQDTQHITTMVRGENIKIVLGTGADAKHVLIQGESIWIWYGDEERFYQGLLSENPIGESDVYQRILSYEEVLSLNKRDILSADYMEYEGEPCIYVEYVSGEFNYKNSIYISVKSGLLMGAETFDEQGKLIYKMTSEPVSASTPGEEFFLPPGPGL